MLRALDIGQYNLEISNAELSDDSLYECQATEAALRSRRAKLNVLSKCDLAADALCREKLHRRPQSGLRR